MDFDDDFDFDEFDFDDEIADDSGGFDDDLDTGGFATDDFDFDDDLGGIEGDIDDLDDLDELDETDSDFFDDIEEGGGGGPSRTFIIAAGAMIVLFIISLVVVVILATRPRDLSENAKEATRITILNATVAQQAEETRVAQELTAAAPTLTPTPSVPMGEFVVDTDVRLGPNDAFEIIGMAPVGTQAEIAAVSPDMDWYRVIYPDGEGWVLAANVATAADLGTLPEEAGPPLPASPTPEATETEVAQVPTTEDETPPPEATEAPTEIPAQAAVDMTATALAGLLEPSPTPEEMTPAIGGPTTVAGAPTALPETGLLDDVFSGGSQGLSVFILMAFGLVGVIVVSRRLRAMNG